MKNMPAHHRIYQLYGHTYRHYRANDTHWCLDVSRHDDGPARWEIICYDIEHRVRLALLDVVCTPQVPLVPDCLFTATITGRFSPRECAPHADTLRGHGFAYITPACQPPHWAKRGCTLAALNEARALAATLNLRYDRKADAAEVPA
jgi:hypothetical protein